MIGDRYITCEERSNMVLTEELIENSIKCAEACGIIQDKRSVMPIGKPGKWQKRAPKDILGFCLHQNGSNNFTDPIATARYHTSQGNHIMRDGRPMPSIVYDIAIPDLPGPAWLVSDLLDRKYAQSSRSHAGDENTHLLSILMMGGYAGPGNKGQADMPSKRQMKALSAVVLWLENLFGFDEGGGFGHYMFGKAGCPGFWGMEWLSEYRADWRGLESDFAWQEALASWNASCLLEFGVDGDWGNESKRALTDFQRNMGISRTGMQDPFTELTLLRHIISKADPAKVN